MSSVCGGTHKRKNQRHEAMRNSPTRMGESVLASAPAMPNSARRLACSTLLGNIWTIMLRLLGTVRTAKSAHTARRTKNAYWSCTKEMASHSTPRPK